MKWEQAIKCEISANTGDKINRKKMRQKHEDEAGNIHLGMEKLVQTVLQVQKLSVILAVKIPNRNSRQTIVHSFNVLQLLSYIATKKSL